ncbi:MAG: hypothetical protein ACRDZY_14235, partial [Acidimicrobiales bacterium]
MTSLPPTPARGGRSRAVSVHFCVSETEKWTENEQTDRELRPPGAVTRARAWARTGLLVAMLAGMV